MTDHLRSAWWRILAVVVVWGGLSLPVPAWAQLEADDEQPAAPASDQDYYELMKIIVDTFEQIDRSYVKEVNRRQLVEAAVRGMLEELDQYSSYISPEEVARFNQQVEQEFGGIGIQVNIDPQTKRLTVMTPLPGTPAYKAGIRAGDTIMEIEGESTEGYSLEQAVERLKGKPGEAVKIGVRHAGSDQIEQVEIVRDIIHVATVLGDRYGSDGQWEFMYDEKDKLGYIRLTHFSRHSAQELKDALTQLKEQGMRGLVLDLRFNPGGLLSQATDIADLFIEEGSIVSTKGRNTPERVWRAKKPGTFSGFPMAVLVNRYSASASEILSACLQDHKRAVVVGERTWGKGSVQNVIELEGGASALKLTTASYHRPSGKNIHRFPDSKDSDDWGVLPDENLEVKQSLKEMQEYLEFRRERDVLKEDGPPKAEFSDRQLDKALEYLRRTLASTVSAPKANGNKADEDAKPVEAKRPAAGAATLPRIPLRMPRSAAI